SSILALPSQAIPLFYAMKQTTFSLVLDSRVTHAGACAEEPKRKCRMLCHRIASKGRPRMRDIRIALLFLLIIVALPANAQDWANWRGPNYNGSTAANGLPTVFSPAEGVKWSADLPGPSAGTPVIYGDSVFVSST